MAPGELDGYWLLTDSTVASRPATAPAADFVKGAGGLPRRWVLVQESDPQRAQQSVDQAMAAFRAGADEVTLRVTPAMAESLGKTLGRVGAAIGEVEAVVEQAGADRPARWALALARAMATVESIYRQARLAEAGGAGAATAPAVGQDQATATLMGLVAKYLDSETGSEMLAELSPRELQQVRELLLQLVLRVGFELAGRQLPPDVPGVVGEHLAAQADPQRAVDGLAQLLTDRLAAAPPSAVAVERRRLVLDALRHAPRAIQVVQAVVAQWPKVQCVGVEIVPAPAGATVVADIRIMPGQELRLEKIETGVPVIAFRGWSRVVVMPGEPAGVDRVVTFDPQGEGGAVELRFEGIVYSLVRLLAFPLASGALREVRVSSAGEARGPQFLQVAMLMETADKPDPRRMLLVQNTSRKDLHRDAFSISEVTLHSHTAMSYITPQRIYTYERSTTSGGQGGQ
jgi:hypothetical protein